MGAHEVTRALLAGIRVRNASLRLIQKNREVVLLAANGAVAAARLSGLEGAAVSALTEAMARLPQGIALEAAAIETDSLTLADAISRYAHSERRFLQLSGAAQQLEASGWPGPLSNRARLLAAQAQVARACSTDLDTAQRQLRGIRTHLGQVHSLAGLTSHIGRSIRVEAARLGHMGHSFKTLATSTRRVAEELLATLDDLEQATTEALRLVSSGAHG